MVDQAYQAYGDSNPNGGLPIIGLFPCLYCTRRFSLKRRLKLHYRQHHSECIPSYEGESISPLEHP